MIKLLAHRRHDITDRAWSLIENLLPGRPGQPGGTARNNREFINAVFWIHRTGSPWRDLAPDFGCWKNVHRRFIRWRDKNRWEQIFMALLPTSGFGALDLEWIIADATHCKVHHHAAGARGGNEAMSRTRGGVNTKIHVLADSFGMPINIEITDGTTADCTQLIKLAKPFVHEAENLLGDKAYDTNEIIAFAQANKMSAVIPSKSNRKEQRDHDRSLYKLRHMVENAMWTLKQWRGIATRYAKRVSSFRAIVHARLIHIWLKVL